jgi:hypothetical protein
MNLRFACVPPRRKEAARAAADPGAPPAEARLYLYEGIDVIFTPQLPDTQAEELHTHTLMAEPSSSPAKCGAAWWSIFVQFIHTTLGMIGRLAALDLPHVDISYKLVFVQWSPASLWMLQQWQR